MKFFKKIKEERLQNYDYDVHAMNQLGLLYIDQDLSTALEVFGMVIALYPNSFIGYDSYGYVLSKMGKRKLAIEYYKKSLRLNPYNLEGKQALAKLEGE